MFVLCHNLRMKESLIFICFFVVIGTLCAVWFVFMHCTNKIRELQDALHQVYQETELAVKFDHEVSIGLVEQVDNETMTAAISQIDIKQKNVKLKSHNRRETYV